MDACICHIDVLPVRTKLYAVGSIEIVCHGLHDTGKRLEAVHLLPNSRFGTEILPVAVLGVCKPKVAGHWVLGYII